MLLNLNAFMFLCSYFVQHFVLAVVLLKVLYK